MGKELRTDLMTFKIFSKKLFMGKMLKNSYYFYNIQRDCLKSKALIYESK